VFEEDEEVEKILASEPWSFDKHVMILQRYEKTTPIKELVFDEVSLWVQVHDLPACFMKWDVAKEICEVVGVVGRSPKDSEVERGSFLRIRVSVDVSLPLCRGRIISMEDGTENWVTFKYERLPNIWCGCLNHVDKDCDHWIESDGTLTKDDQEYGPWICAGPTAMFRNSVVKVPGFYEARKKKAPEEKQDSGGVFPMPERS